MAGRKQTGKKQSGLALDGGSRPRKREVSRQGWTATQERAFLSGLAGTCNVKLAAAQAEVSTSAAYVRRNNDAGFRKAWGAAIREGYAKLELMLLERALKGTEKIVRHRDGSEQVMREYSDRLALGLMRMHRDTVEDSEAQVSDEEADEARVNIVRKLARLKAQVEATKAKGEPGDAGEGDDAGKGAAV